MTMDFSDFINALGGNDLEEIPVGVEEFVRSPQYLDLPPLSPAQYQIVKMGTQIYKKETLIKAYGEEEGDKRFKETRREVVLCLGKSSGKDYTSTIVFAYVVYLLLCLKEPARYYGLAPESNIDLINVAVNATQAKHVFFKEFSKKINRSPWFAGRFKQKSDTVEFDKYITVHSGHSEREAWEGFNLFMAALDEISAFNLESATGNQSAKTAADIYKMFRGSVDSRFDEFGKVILLSFPRFKGDYITTHYESVIVDKEVRKEEHTFKIHPELPDGLPDNELLVEWEEDIITKYNRPGVFALRRPTWKVNPQKTIESFRDSFITDPVDALGRFAAMPPDMIDAYFPSRERIEAAFNRERSNIEDGFLAQDFIPNERTRYFMHVDLAQKHDRCAVAMAHVESWGKTEYIDSFVPRLVVDFVRYWEPDVKKGVTVDFTEVKDFIVSVKRRGVNLSLVTFDHWQSFDMMQQLAQAGINCDTLPVAKKHYDDFKLAVSEGRVSGPNDPKLIKELVQLRIVRDKVDHPRSGFKDISDATCGALYNAGRYSPRYSDTEIEIITLSDVTRKTNKLPDDVITAPKSEMPKSLNDIIMRMI